MKNRTCILGGTRMDGKQLWENLFTRLSDNEEQLKTKYGLWFKAFVKHGDLYIDGSTEHNPSCEIRRPRRISESDFLLVFSCYDRWASGTTGIRQIISQKSVSAAYIFALIDLVK